MKYFKLLVLVLVLSLFFVAQGIAQNYAKIDNGVVSIIVIDTDQALENLRSAGLEIIDISDMEIKPKSGWTYKNKEFIKSEKKQVDVLPVIELLDVDAMTVAERWKKLFELLGQPCK